MLSDKLVSILRSKTSLSAETIAGMSEAEGWNAVYALNTPKVPKAPSVCLTGFSQPERDELAQLAAVRGIKVVGSVNQGILFLCTGATPGPAKLAKAASLGIPAISSAELRIFFETGELPYKPG
jgi:NAD-dependent DNA ligase